MRRTATQQDDDQQGTVADLGIGRPKSSEGVQLGRHEEKTGSLNDSSAESTPQPQNSGTITTHSQGDSQPYQSSTGTTLVDAAWGRPCARCGNGAGVRLDPGQADAKCPCRKDNLKSPAQFIQPPGEPPVKQIARSQETNMVIPRSGTFISNRRGELVTLVGPDPIPGMHKTGRAGFTQGKIRPNHTRQRRSMQAAEMRPILPVPFKHAVSNSLTR